MTTAIESVGDGGANSGGLADVIDSILDKGAFVMTREPQG